MSLQSTQTSNYFYTKPAADSGASKINDFAELAKKYAALKRQQVDLTKRNTEISKEIRSIQKDSQLSFYNNKDINWAEFLKEQNINSDKSSFDNEVLSELANIKESLQNNVILSVIEECQIKYSGDDK